MNIIVEDLVLATTIEEQGMECVLEFVSRSLNHWSCVWRIVFVQRHCIVLTLFRVSVGL